MSRRYQQLWFLLQKLSKGKRKGRGHRWDIRDGSGPARPYLPDGGGTVPYGLVQFDPTRQKTGHPSQRIPPNPPHHGHGYGPGAPV